MVLTDEGLKPIESLDLGGFVLGMGGGKGEHQGHEKSERRTWSVIVLCGAMMVAEIVGGLMFGSIALVADGLHMSTHAGALLLAALAYSYARRHASDERFSFGTGKLGDLAGFSSAIILAMISLLIAYESISRIFAPVPIHFAEAIPIACLGLAAHDLAGIIEAQRRTHHRSCVFLGYIADFEAPESWLDASLPHASLLGGCAGLVLYGHHFLAIPIPQIGDGPLPARQGGLGLGPMPFGLPVNRGPLPKRGRPLTGPLSLPKLAELLLRPLQRPAL